MKIMIEFILGWSYLSYIHHKSSHSIIIPNQQNIMIQITRRINDEIFNILD